MFFIVLFFCVQLLSSPENVEKIYQGQDVVWSFAVVNSEEFTEKFMAGETAILDVSV